MSFTHHTTFLSFSINEDKKLRILKPLFVDLDKYNSFVIGGFARWAFKLHGDRTPPYNDIDIYCPSTTNFEDVLFLLISKYALDIVNVSSRAVTLKTRMNHENHPLFNETVQIIKPIKGVKNAYDLFNNFDITVCCFGLRLDQNRSYLIFCPYSAQHDENTKRLVFKNLSEYLRDDNIKQNPDIFFNLYKRMLSYLKKGYRLEPQAMVPFYDKLLFAPSEIRERFIDKFRNPRAFNTPNEYLIQPRHRRMIQSEPEYSSNYLGMIEDHPLAGV